MTRTEGKAAEALARKRARGDGTARLLGGDQDQVVEQIADHYLARRDVLLAAGSKLEVTVSAPTNEDVADISRAVRARMRARGEIGADEVVYRAIDQRGETYDLPLATGDRVRLFRRTMGRIDGKVANFGSNGDTVTVLGCTEAGLLLRDKAGRTGEVEWRRLTDGATGRLLLGFGHALTVDAAQGITSGEHINALPRGTAGVTAFKGYVAESRAKGTTWTMISEAATFEAVKRGRALGDATPITSEDLWAKAAEGLAQKPYKPLGSDLLSDIREGREKATLSFIRFQHMVETAEHQGRDLGREIREHRQAVALQAAMPRSIAALDAALSLMRGGSATAAEEHLRRLRVETEVARREIEGVAKPSTPSAGMG